MEHGCSHDSGRLHLAAHVRREHHSFDDDRTTVCRWWVACFPDQVSDRVVGEEYAAWVECVMNNDVGVRFGRHSSKCLAMRRKAQNGISGDGPTELNINGQIVDTQNRIGRHTTPFS